MASYDESAKAMLDNMEHMDSFIENNEFSFQLNEDGVLVVALNGKEISKNGRVSQGDFESNVKGSLFSSNGKRYFDMLMPIVYFSIRESASSKLQCK